MDEKPQAFINRHGRIQWYQPPKIEEIEAMMPIIEEPVIRPSEDVIAMGLMIVMVALTMFWLSAGIFIGWVVWG